MSKASRAVLGTLLFIGVGIGAFWTVVNYFPNAFGHYFTVRHVRIKGEASPGDAQALQGALTSSVSGNLFTIDTEKVEDALMRLSWIKTASIRRVWPDALEIAIIKHRAIAQFEDGRFVADDGALFTIEGDAPVAAGLPEFFGQEAFAPDMVKRYQAFFAVIEKTQPRFRVAEISVTDRGSWTVVLDVGESRLMSIVLGIDHADDSIAARFEEVLRQYPEVVRILGTVPERIDARYRSAFAASLSQVNQ
ncbi:MAG TPA: hypothetical protein DCW60_03340 [Sutterella sp.]|nr:hypothetical protein [Sutterella sp.]